MYIPNVVLNKKPELFHPITSTIIPIYIIYIHSDSPRTLIPTFFLNN